MRLGLLNNFPKQPTMHGFLRAEVRAVAYDATLQGGYFSSNNVHTVQPKPVVGEVELGVVWQERHYGLRASIVKRGSEIRDLSNAIGSHKFVRLQFVYSP